MKRKEIQNEMKNTRNMTCRDDIITRVFHAKLKELLKDLTQKHVLGMLILLYATTLKMK